jgi:signal transduction histidine kinase
MKIPPNLCNEQDRIRELQQYEILDTPEEESFDEVVALASQICDVPFSLITLVDVERQWFKAKKGIPISETDKQISFCAHAIAWQEDLFQIKDASTDDRFYDNPLVKDGIKIKFYAGVPLVTKKGFKLGTLCVADNVPKHLNEYQTFALKVLAKQVMNLIELRSQNKKLEEQRNKLMQQASMQNKITAIIAHDVRGPLAGLKQLMEYAKNHVNCNEECSEIIHASEQQLDSTLILLSELLEWGKAQASAFVPKDCKPIQLYNLIEEKFKKFVSVAAIKKNKLVNLVDEDLSFFGDEDVLRFILRNLLSNANKFTHNGTIRVYAQKEKGEVLISVSDTGVGISNEKVNHLFNPNITTTTNGTLNEKGMGMGLMLVNDFVEMMQWNITVKSQPNKGTTFYIKIKG